MKMFIARIGYVDYAFEQADAAELLAIAARAKVVKQNGYSGPYYVQHEQEVFVDVLALQEVEFPAVQTEPDKFSAATRETASF